MKQSAQRIHWVIAFYVYDTLKSIIHVLIRCWIYNNKAVKVKENSLVLAPATSKFWATDASRTCSVPNDEGNEPIVMIHDLRSVCLIYLGIVIDSTILNTREHHALHSLLLPHFSTQNQHYYPFKLLKLSLIYGATDVQFDEKTFYESCKGRNNLLVVMENNFKNVIGGFMSNADGIKSVSKYNLHSILQTSEPIFDANAFLFRLRSNTHLSPQIFTFQHKKQEYYRHALTTNSGKIFAFGWTDVALFKSSKITTRRKIGRCFVKPAVYAFDAIEYSGGCDVETFTNHMSTFDVDRMEIFQIEL
eukprot:196141_1